MSLKGTYRSRVEEMSRMVLTVCGWKDEYKPEATPEDGFGVGVVALDVKYFFNDLFDFSHLEKMSLMYPLVFTILSNQGSVPDKLKRFKIDWECARLLVPME
jgi:hypothetical protein